MSSLTPDLKQVRWKIARAKKQLDTLRDEVAAYLDDSPYRLVTEEYTEPDAPNDRAVRVLFKIDREPPDDSEWIGWIGEIAYNCRSALDQLIVQLIIASGNVPSERSRTQYPIFLNPDDYREKSRGARINRRGRMLEGVASRFRKIIDDSQPYHRSGRVSRDPLAILETISNRDKHREPHPRLVWMRDMGIKFTKDGKSVRIGVGFGQDSPQPLSDGDSLISIAPDEPDAQMEIGDDLEVAVGFQTDTGVITVEDLERVVATVSEIIHRSEAKIASKRP